jgi:SET domain-containing protein
VIDLRQSKHTVLSVGKAMAVAPCLLNHSCFPNAQVVWSGRHLVVKAVTPVARGDEITICYRPNVIQALESAQDRRDYLRDVFYFDCDCKGT